MGRKKDGGSPKHSLLVEHDFQTYIHRIHRMDFIYKPKESGLSPPLRENPDVPQHPDENSPFTSDWGVRSHNQTILIVKVVAMGAKVLECSMSLNGWAGYTMIFGAEAFELHIDVGIGLVYTELSLGRCINHQRQITIKV